MKLPELTKPTSAGPRAARWLAVGLLIVLFAIPTQAFAQCAGAVGIENDGTDLNGNFIPDYVFGDLGSTVNWTLTPRAGDVLNVTVDQVKFGLTCWDNGDAVPCDPPGNDGQAGNNALTPLQFTSLTGGTCNATLNSVAAGIVTFDLPEATLNQTGCTIIFATELQDRGIDSTINFVTPAVAFDGTCSGGLDGSAAGSAALEIVDPEIDVTKTGPDTAKVGDEITYTIGFTALSDGALLGVCTGNDTVLGPLGVFVDGVPRDFLYTVKVDDPRPLPNTATITCDVTGSASDVSDFDNHSVTVIDPSINVTKTGPDTAKVGDEITYTIGFTDTGTGTLGECTGSDTLLGDLGVFVDGVTRDFLRTALVTDPNPLPNTATITCDVEGFDNQASGSDGHSVDLIDPSVDLTKECRPDPVNVDETIEWAITVNNTGDIDLDCVVNDPTAGFVDEPVMVAAGGSETLNASRTVVIGDAPVISNTATVSCPIPGFDNEVDASDTADCEVVVVNEFCRTPGFWGLHADDSKRRAHNLTQIVMDYVPGLVICGEVVNNTDVPSNESAIEAMCVSPQGDLKLQLARHLTAAALNCVVSGGGADCTGVSIGADWAIANDVCINGGDYSYWGGIIDDWNNGVACHETEFSDSEVFDGIAKLPGPASSSRLCNRAIRNNVTIFSPDP